ncbi:Zn-dependent exopeptidase [Coemansia reversa NRRL 1564]|uniref:Zn-dependent exopeptidase n=1 Tax=Coemansia reversa (strain ATCC 12441 / NRRL 1564) TaxID=763665 RepID=A0A2G5B1J9_COERN|nr:Zn-dependent exopeptidase [Coemansia reversa NRRL 1564]|eukprot:PIA12898.1 Zn-dependent exopeptidase [Coemansia reversa NRRL 1564]
MATLPSIRTHLAYDSLSASSHDVLVIVSTSLDALQMHCAAYDGWAKALAPFRRADRAFGSSVVLVPVASVGGGRLVFSPTGSLDDDTDDVRKIYDAVKRGVAKAIEAGARRPAVMLAIQPPLTDAGLDADYSRSTDVALLAALDASYVTLVVREYRQATLGAEAVVENLLSIDLVVNAAIDKTELHAAVERVAAIETGRRLTLDMGYGDPERMTPHKCAQTIKSAVAAVSGIEYEEITDLDVIKRDYPLLYNSARASFAEKRTWPCVVKLEYRSPEPAEVKEHLYLVGKGVTFDTGGISLKTGGSMRGMSYDKLGACAVAGFAIATGVMRAAAVNLSCVLAFERNSIGPNSLLPDEVLLSRAGVRVLINDTDAEGRLVMADPVAECRERIMAGRAAGYTVPSAIYTVATLTGHVIRAYGFYGATVANGPARRGRYDRRIAAAGSAYGDPFENSIMRREDHDFVRSRTDREDVYQSNHQPSTLTDRGHQYPAAFLIKASGLDKHSLQAGEAAAIPFVHLDIAGSAEDGADQGLGLGGLTGSPVATFAGAFWTSS